MKSFFFQNGEFLKNGDGAEVDPNLVELNVTTDILTQVFLGMCAYNERYYNYTWDSIRLNFNRYDFQQTFCSKIPL